MKILITTQYYYPDTFLINDVSRMLVNAGHDVTVLTGLPDYETGEIPIEYRSRDKWDQTIEGVRVVRSRISPRKQGIVNRALNYWSFAHFSYSRLKKLNESFDIIFCYQPSPISSAHAGVKWGQKVDIPTIIYCCDLWPESLKAWGISESNPIYRLIKSYSRKVYSTADHVAVSSKPFIDYFSRVHGLDEFKMSYLPQFAPDCYANSYMYWDENGVIDFVFAGNIGSVQMVDSIVDAASVLRNIPNLPEWKIHIFGNGSEFESVKKKVMDLDLENLVKLYGRISQDELTTHYKKSDVFILTLKHDNHIGDTLPSKIQGYFSAGRPVIAMAGGATKEVLADAECGDSVAAGDIDGFAQLMKKYCESKSLIRKNGVKARVYYEKHFTDQIFMKNLLHTFELTLKGNN